MAVQQIFAGGQVAANAVTTQQLTRGLSEAGPIQAAQLVQVQSLQRHVEDAAERAPTTLADVGQTPTYDVRARVETVPGDGRRRGSLFDRRA